MCGLLPGGGLTRTRTNRPCVGSNRKPRAACGCPDSTGGTVALGEEFGMAPGELVIDKIYHALKMLGIDTVFDTNFSADLTIMEEGTEFLNRLSAGGPFPLITSCSPGWIKFGETYFPDLIENISSCKSPQQMMGSLIKTYFSETRGIPPEKIVSLSIMPYGK